VLKRDIPKVFPKGTKMYLDHPTVTENKERPERSVKDLAAALASDPKWEKNGPDGPGMYANAKVLEDKRELVNQMAPFIGLSIRAGGLVERGEAEGREGQIVKAIEVGDSVDFVTEPGRGGKILELYESLRKHPSPPTPLPQSGRGETREAKGKGTQQEKEQEMAEIDELKKSNAELTEAGGKKDEELARLREAVLLRDAHDHAAAKLAKIEGLPEPTKNRLVESLAKKSPVTKESTLDKEAFDQMIEEAVKAEAQYLAKIGLGGKIAGQGSDENAEQDEETLKEAQETLNDAFQRMGLDESKAKHAAQGRR
ncbi:MAG: hypothetical protein L0170_12500, partial [Acidobacteria bacterium]|nr:hypothetical protein [Acidobacteriota bacterium]